MINFIGLSFGDTANGFYITIGELETENYSGALLWFMYNNGQISFEVLYSNIVVDLFNKLRRD